MRRKKHFFIAFLLTTLFILDISMMGNASRLDVAVLGGKSNKMISPNSFDYEKSELFIEDLLVEDGKLFLKGEIEKNSFNIQGEIYNSRIHDEKLVIDSHDIDGNFEIIHTGFFHKLPEDYELIFGNNFDTDIFLLYLKNDNNYYVYEFELMEDNIKNISQISYEEYGQQLVDIEHWWIKVYEPEFEELNNISYGRTVSKTQRIRYPENRYTYEMDLILELDARDLYRDRADGSAIIFIEDQRTYYNGRLEDDAEILGVINSNIMLFVNGQSNDVFRRLEWDTYTHYNRPIIGVSFGWGYGPFNINYEGSSNRESGSKVIPSSSSRQYQAMEVNNRTPIKKVGDSHQVFYDIEELSYYSGGHFITADFEYDIFLLNQHTIVDSDGYSLTAVYR